MKQVNIKHFSSATKVARRPAHTIAVDCADQGAENKVSFFLVQEVLHANQWCGRKQTESHVPHERDLKKAGPAEQLSGEPTYRSSGRK